MTFVKRGPGKSLGRPDSARLTASRKGSRPGPDPVGGCVRGWVLFRSRRRWQPLSVDRPSGNEIDLDEPFRSGQTGDIHERGSRSVPVEVCFPDGSRLGMVGPVDQKHVQLDDVGDLHAGGGEHRSDVVPDQTGLLFDTLTDGSVCPYAGLTGSEENTMGAIQLDAVGV